MKFSICHVERSRDIWPHRGLIPQQQPDSSISVGMTNAKKVRCKMKRLNGYRMRMMLVGIAAGIVLGGVSAKADFTFGMPMLFDEPVNSTGVEYFDCISADGLEVYIEKPVTGGTTSSYWDIYVSTRETINDPWSVPVNLGPTVNSSGVIDAYASLSSDGLELYFSSRRPGAYGPQNKQDIWVTRRAYKGADWGNPMNLGPTINTSSSDWLPWITSDGLELYFSSDRPGGYGNSDIWVARRINTNDEWEEPVNLGPVVNSTAIDCYPCLAPGGLVLFFSDYDNTPIRPGGHGRSDMYMTRRKSTADPWEPPVNLGLGINTSSYDCQPRISPDGSVLYFTSSRPDSSVVPGNTDIWQVPITPIIDLNNDGVVDSLDMCIMIDHWGENYPLCDIGPTPFGDGIVDIEDLIVLSEHLFEDYRLVAHWALDEDAGNTAYDSASENDATLQGGPIWQPYGGKVGGALQFDGIDDYVSTPFILNPNKGSFSVSAWIKGGGPGQVIISQSDLGRDQGNTWLLADASYGRLMTRLMHPPFPPLVSESVITDDQWHHVGLIFDIITLHRYLYVDGIEVAKDSDYVAGVGSDGGLYIGVDKTLDAASFFSGLIDDVRIYNNVLNAEDIAALSQ